MSGSKLSNPAAKKNLTESPLAMTVHDMPAPGDVVQADSKKSQQTQQWQIFQAR